MNIDVRMVLLRGVVTLMAVVLPAFPAWSHEGLARTVAVQAGSYRLVVGFMSDPPHVENPLEVTVRADAGGPSLEGATLTLIGLPGLGTDATPTRLVNLKPQAGEPGEYAGAVSLTVRGAWNLRLDIQGPGGSGTVFLPVTVAAPAAMPPWLGWLIAMSPLSGVAWFGWWNRRYLERLRVECALVKTS